MGKHPKKEFVRASDVVAIVGDATLAGPALEGVNVPLVILDTSKRPDIEEIIRVHKHLSPGDVGFQWGGVENRSDDILLVLDFQRPIETRAVLRFSIEKQGILIEGALTARAIYLQGGRPEDRLKDDPERPKLLVELPDVEFRAKWDQLFLDRMTSVFSRRTGLRRREAEPLARGLIEEVRVITTFRMPKQT